MPRHNPERKEKKRTVIRRESVTGKNYKITQRSEVNPEAGSIRGLWPNATSGHNPKLIKRSEVNPEAGSIGGIWPKKM